MSPLQGEPKLAQARLTARDMPGGKGYRILPQSSPNALSSRLKRGIFNNSVLSLLYGPKGVDVLGNPTLEPEAAAVAARHQLAELHRRGALAQSVVKKWPLEAEQPSDHLIPVVMSVSCGPFSISAYFPNQAFLWTLDTPSFLSQAAVRPAPSC